MLAPLRSATAVLFFSWLASSTLAVAQMSITDVHVPVREKPVALASAMYSAPKPEAALIRSRVDLVLVPVSITDQMNRPVVGLEQSNFELFENKKRQEIKNFSSEDSPISLGILVDTSGSMSYKLERAREAVRQFCETANPADEFFMITFADEPRLATDFTRNSEELTDGLLTARSHGSTSLLDAIYMGIEKMRGAQYGRKALLIISDGGDNHSRYSERDVKTALKESEVAVFSVGTFESWFGTREEQLGPELLRNLAQLTGGSAFSLDSAAQLPAVSRNIGVQLRHQYVLAYAPQAEQRNGKWHKINIKLRVPRRFPFLQVKARSGYYAGSE